MESYWVNFAKTGDPNGPGLPLWPAFGASSQKAMFLDADPGAHPMPNMQQIKALDAYFAWRRAEAKNKLGN
jgi:para-nitrobenzyl esterase